MHALAACDHTTPVGSSSDADIKSGGHTVNIIEWKGEFLGAGATGVIQRLESGDVVKSPWMGRPTTPDSKIDLAIKAQIYQRL